MSKQSLEEQLISIDICGKMELADKLPEDMKVITKKDLIKIIEDSKEQKEDLEKSLKETEREINLLDSSISVAKASLINYEEQLKYTTDPITIAELEKSRESTIANLRSMRKEMSELCEEYFSDFNDIKVLDEKIQNADDALNNMPNLLDKIKLYREEKLNQIAEGVTKVKTLARQSRNYIDNTVSKFKQGIVTIDEAKDRLNSMADNVKNELQAMKVKHQSKVYTKYLNAFRGAVADISNLYMYSTEVLKNAENEVREEIQNGKGAKIRAKITNLDERSKSNILFRPAWALARIDYQKFMHEQNNKLSRIGQASIILDEKMKESAKEVIKSADKLHEAIGLRQAEREQVQKKLLCQLKKDTFVDVMKDMDTKLFAQKKGFASLSEDALNSKIFWSSISEYPAFDTYKNLLEQYDKGVLTAKEVVKIAEMGAFDLRSEENREGALAYMDSLVKDEVTPGLRRSIGWGYDAVSSIIYTEPRFVILPDEPTMDELILSRMHKDGIINMHEAENLKTPMDLVAAGIIDVETIDKYENIINEERHQELEKAARELGEKAYENYTSPDITGFMNFARVRAEHDPMFKNIIESIEKNQVIEGSLFPEGYIFDSEINGDSFEIQDPENPIELLKPGAKIKDVKAYVSKDTDNKEVLEVKTFIDTVKNHPENIPGLNEVIADKDFMEADYVKDYQRKAVGKSMIRHGKDLNIVTQGIKMQHSNLAKKYEDEAR